MATGAEKSVLVPIADGSEEMEAVIVIDVLRRAGANVTVASAAPSLEVICSRGVKLVADRPLGDCVGDAYDLVVLPGGMPGAEHLRDSPELTSILRDQRAAGKPYAAVCASPAVVLQHHGLLEDVPRATCHPGFVDKISDKADVEQRVVQQGLVTTSRGPGTSFEFALTLVKTLFGEEKAKEVAGPMVMYQHTLP
ncbi:unnamed protein product [Pedinophyceae sp. YPF-701]|nr:unnamed protein product [Pedinophyceae sp. YPF-701]